MTQLALAFSATEHYQAHDFFISPCNEEAHALISTWPQGWLGKQAIITGGAGSGKSHLLSMWHSHTHAITLDAGNIAAITRQTAQHAPPAAAATLDNVDSWAGNESLEQELFHFLNQWQLVGGWLLLTAQSAPQHWGIQLPDLRSRLMAMQGCRLQEPDDSLLMQLLIKLAYDHACPLRPALVEYLARHMPRSFTAARQLITMLNHMSLQEKKPVTMPMAKLAIAAITTTD